MKRIFAICLVGVIIIFGVFYMMDYLKIKKDHYEFVAFQNFLNEGFFPVLNDSFLHLDQAADELEGSTFVEWYQQAEGLEENAMFQAKIEDTEIKVLDEKVQGENSLRLKKNILEQIMLLQDTFILLYDSANKTELSTTALHEAFSANVEGLSLLSEQMDTIIEENTVVEEE